MLIELNRCAVENLRQIPRIHDFYQNRELSLSLTYIQLIAATNLALFTASLCALREGLICVVRIVPGQLIRKSIPILEACTGRNLSVIGEEFTIEKVTESFHNFMHYCYLAGSSLVPYFEFHGILCAIGVPPCFARPFLDELFDDLYEVPLNNIPFPIQPPIQSSLICEEDRLS